MGSGSRIDRRKGHVDILEQVVKGVRPEIARGAAKGAVVDFGLRAWIGGVVTSAVQVQVAANTPPDDEPGN